MEYERERKIVQNDIVFPHLRFRKKHNLNKDALLPTFSYLCH